MSVDTKKNHFQIVPVLYDTKKPTFNLYLFCMMNDINFKTNGPKKKMKKLKVRKKKIKKDEKSLKIGPNRTKKKTKKHAFFAHFFLFFARSF